MKKYIFLTTLLMLGITMSNPDNEKGIGLKNQNELIFVYNANSGFVNGMIDYTHKIISPETYSCNLCALTYNNFGKVDQWKSFVENIGIPMHFKYKNNFHTISPEIGDVALPVLVLKQKDNFSILIQAEQINQCKTLNELIELVSSRVQTIVEL